MQTLLSAHDQRNKWADNSKTNRARVFILAHDTHFDKLSSHVSFCFIKLSCTVQELWQFSLTDFTFSTKWLHTGRLRTSHYLPGKGAGEGEGEVRIHFHVV